jgi:hypothetical protein
MAGGEPRAQRTDAAGAHDGDPKISALGHCSPC